MHFKITYKTPTKSSQNIKLIHFNRIFPSKPSISSVPPSMLNYPTGRTRSPPCCVRSTRSFSAATGSGGAQGARAAGNRTIWAWRIWGFPYGWGYPMMDGLEGKMPIKMDENNMHHIEHIYIYYIYIYPLVNIEKPIEHGGLVR